MKWKATNTIEVFYTMKNFFRCFCLWMVVLLPFTIHAEVTGEIIFRHKDNPNELWITDVEDTSNARLFFKFKQENIIRRLSVQKDGPFIVVAADRDAKTIEDDIFFINTNRLNVGERNLTNKQFTHIVDDLATSSNGDILFTNTFHEQAIYLIPKHEIDKPHPNIRVLKKVEAGSVSWKPNGDQIAYDVTFGGVFLFNVVTKKELRISKEGRHPVFSPNGKKLAFISESFRQTSEIEIISLETMRTLKIIKDFIPHERLSDLKWSPDGRYIIYTVFALCLFEKCATYHNIAVPLDAGPPIRILDDIQKGGVPYFDFTSTASHAVEPTNRLTTLWGKLKQ